MVINPPPCQHEFVWVPVTTNTGQNFVERCVKCGRDRYGSPAQEKGE